MIVEWAALRKRVGSGSEGEWTTLQKRVDSGSKVVGSAIERRDRDQLFDREACLTAPWIRGVGRLLSTNPMTADTLRPFKYVDKQFVS